MNGDDGERVETLSSALLEIDTIWYSQLHPACYDIISEYAGRESFVVEFDAILQRIFCNKRLDLGRSATGGMQMLHFAYLFHRFVDEFIQGRCVFDIVVIEKNALVSCICDTPESTLARLLARKALLQYIRKKWSKTIKIREYESYRSREWRAYLEENAPYFVLTHDGTGENIASVPASVNLALKLYQRVSIYELYTNNCAVGLIQDLSFKSSKLQTFIIETYRGNKNELIDTYGLAYQESVSLLENFLSSLTCGVSPGISEWSGEPSKWILTGLTDLKLDSFPAKEITYIFILHILLLDCLPLNARIQLDVNNLLNSNLRDYIHSEFLPSFYRQNLQVRLSDEYADKDLLDFIDGRLFLSIVWYYTSSAWHISLEAYQASQLKQLCQHFNLVDLDFGRLKNSFPSTKLDSLPIALEAKTSFNIRNNCLSNLLAGQTNNETAHKTTEWDIIDEEFEEEKKTDSRELWSTRPLVPETRRKRIQQLTDWQKKRIARLEQMYVASTQRYAESITGANGKGIQQMVITTKKRQSKEQVESSTFTKIVEKNGQAKKPSKSKTASKKDQIIAEQNAQKLKKANEIYKKTLKTLLDSLKPGMDLESRFQRLSLASQNALRHNDDMLEINISMLRLQQCVNEWGDICKKNERDDYLDYAWVIVELYKVAQRLYYIDKNVSTAMHAILNTVLEKVGLKNIIPKHLELKENIPLAFKFDMTALEGIDCSIPCKPELFQLQYCGAYMERSMDAQDDSRVPFKPDGWQRKVLDILDANESVIVTAPTSAGKTFIAYYAMELCLTADDDGIVVYVAPTKALVNQIAAEIYARYRKQYQTAGKTVYCIYSKEFRVNDPKNCQILVTVPEMLQVLFMSPEYSKKWVPRLRRVIFDEVHSIGELESGVVWEQLLLLTTVPIIALSATIGNAIGLYGWLKEVQATHGLKLHLVQYEHRYSHLRKYFYTPLPASNTFTGFEKNAAGSVLDNFDNFTVLHPYGALRYIKGKSIPSDLMLESADCCYLLQAMQMVARRHSAPPEDIKRLKELLPGNYFKSKPYIRNADVIEYEQSLREFLTSWLERSRLPENKNSTNLFEETIKTLEGETEQLIKNWEIAYEQKQGVIPEGRQYLRDTCLDMLAQLHAANELPAILFHFDHCECEELAKIVIEKLKYAEDEYKESSAEWKKKLKHWQAWKSAEGDRAKQRARQLKALKDPDERSAMERDNENITWESTFNPEDPLAQYTLTSAGSRYSLSDFKDEMRRISSSRSSVPDWAVEGLKRGIGVHHSGMNRKYRQLVEVLFRAGVLRVVVATGTLALGINMPCKAVIFEGEHAFLNALNYRQCSGRSGRRGFDLLGKVIFHGMQLSKVHRLMVSQIPDLTGHFPLTTSLLLRLCGILTQSDAKYPIETLQGLVEQGRLRFGSGKDQILVKHHLRSTLNLLYDERLIDSYGRPLGLAGLVSHIHPTEPGNIVFAAMLRDGVFHDICKDFGKYTKKEVLEKLMLVLPHIFGCRRRRVFDQQYVDKVRAEHQCRLLLDPLPENAKKSLQGFNRRVLSILENSILHLAETCPETLVEPFDSVVEQVDNRSRTDDNANLIAYFKETTLSRKARSLFASLSGYDDRFETLDDLSINTPRQLYLASSIPILKSQDHPEDETLDAYLYDFWKHGSDKMLIEINGIPRGEVWFVLNDFSQTLNAIMQSLHALALSRSVDPALEYDAEDGDIPVFDVDEVGNELDNLQLNGDATNSAISTQAQKVYEAFAALNEEFLVKFKRMWA